MAAGSFGVIPRLARLSLNCSIQRTCLGSVNACNRRRLLSSCANKNAMTNELKTQEDFYLSPSETVLIPRRTFITGFIPRPGQSRKKKYSERRIIGYSMEDIYAVVADVDDYKNFVPWCRNSSTYNRKPGHFKARICVGFPPLLSETYTSVVSVVPPNMVQSECSDGEMFNYMKTIWKFSPGLHGNQNTCTLDFDVEFEFKSALHSQLSTLFFDEVVKKMVRAFEKRCQYLYGPDHLRQALKSRAAQPNPR
ncbi:coenzyme Q-binding protein COQ10 homolog B, mitochondrial-like [Actinia tenebrosa]|uniref:Coenzyme Q-binding protein COQ10 homolog B, mitochondrial-like n=1 Tax=Actinia tenebrosa TaxID=6105 RepID=A0A6P8HNH0_ACTTE|nr:coenzyme Q-binding protein COQ10 homolog B, mitochondrial-like [Actinia tenebrosa]